MRKITIVAGGLTVQAGSQVFLVLYGGIPGTRRVRELAPGLHRRVTGLHRRVRGMGRQAPGKKQHIVGDFPGMCRSAGRCDGLAAVKRSVCSGCLVCSSVPSGVRATGLLRRLIPEAQNVPGYKDGRRRIWASRRRWCIPEHKAAGQRRRRNQEHERAGQRRRRIQEYEAASVPSPMRATRADPGSGTIDPGGSRTGGGFGGPSPGGPSGGLPGGSFWGGGNEGPVGGPFGQGCQ